MKRFSKILLLLLAFAFLLTACAENGQEAVETNYKITVRNEGGLPVQGVCIVIYEDENRETIVFTGVTDAEGVLGFTKEASENYVAVLRDLPNGFKSEEMYKDLSENYEIRLKNVFSEDVDLGSVSYGVGSVMHDFEITSVDGSVYKLSEISKTKKAVVLNFWFLQCGPCRSEFPFMQQAYADFKDDIEVIAVNPTGDSQKDIIAYANEAGLTFPMADGNPQWESAFGINAYPTTVVIDRFGTVCFMHRGAITDKETFDKLFSYFTSENYKQQIIRNISDIK